MSNREERVKRICTGLRTGLAAAVVMVFFGNFSVQAAFSPPRPLDLVVWLQADGAVTKDGSNLVSSWSDASGNGNTATAIAAKPLWVASQINGKPVIRFTANTGANSTLLQTPSGVVPQGLGFSVFVVAKYSSVTAGTNSFGISNGTYDPSGASTLLSIKDDGTGLKNNVHMSYGVGAQGDLFLGSADTNFHRQAMVWQGSTSSPNYPSSWVFWVDDANVSQNVPSNGSGTFPWICATTGPADIGGQDNTGVLSSSAVDIAEVLVYANNLSTTDQATINNYFKEKYWNIITITADVNGDNVVNFKDIQLFAANWLKCSDPARPTQCQ
jgi:hypothetical protein